jgi:hypothetical protein
MTNERYQEKVLWCLLKVTPLDPILAQGGFSFDSGHKPWIGVGICGI